MEIETLQIKRVTGNWDTHKSIKPLKGEYVLVDIPNSDVPKTLVLGNSTNGVDGDTLQTLLSKPECVIPLKNYVNDVQEDLDEKITNLKPTSGTTADITTNSSSLGDANTFAPSNHTHKITKETVTNVLANNGFEYHGIKFGTDDPTESNITGSNGDIYIRYEDSV